MQQYTACLQQSYFDILTGAADEEMSTSVLHAVHVVRTLLRRVTIYVIILNVCVCVCV